MKKNQLDPQVEEWLARAQDGDRATVILLLDGGETPENQRPKIADYLNHTAYRQACIKVFREHRERNTLQTVAALRQLELTVRDLPLLGIAIVEGGPAAIRAALEVEGVEGTSWNHEMHLIAPVEKGPFHAA